MSFSSFSSSSSSSFSSSSSSFSSSSSSFDYNQYKQQLGRIHNIIDDLNADLDQSYSQLRLNMENQVKHGWKYKNSKLDLNKK